jgi:heme-binding NEAT domain protein
MKANRRMSLGVLALSALLVFTGCERKQRQSAAQKNAAAAGAGSTDAGKAKPKTDTPKTEKPNTGTTKPVVALKAENLEKDRTQLIEELNAEGILKNTFAEVTDKTDPKNIILKEISAENMMAPASKLPKMPEITVSLEALMKNLDTAVSESESTETDATKKKESAKQVLSDELKVKVEALNALILKYDGQDVVGVEKADMADEISRLKALKSLLDLTENKILGDAIDAWIKK